MFLLIARPMMKEALSVLLASRATHYSMEFAKQFKLTVNLKTQTVHASPASMDLLFTRDNVSR